MLLSHICLNMGMSECMRWSFVLLSFNNKHLLVKALNKHIMIAKSLFHWFSPFKMWQPVRYIKIRMVQNYKSFKALLSARETLWFQIGNSSLAVAKNLVEEGAKLTLLPREVELGVVGQSLGQVQLDEPDEDVGQCQIWGHFCNQTLQNLVSGSVWSDTWSVLGFTMRLTFLNRGPRWPSPAVQVCISQCLPCYFLLPGITCAMISR